MRRWIAVLLVPALLALTACSGGGETQQAAKPDQASVADITVKGSWDKAPKVSFPAPIAFDELGVKKVISGPGKGEAVTKASRVTVRYIGYNASNTTEIDNSWEQDDPSVSLLVSQVIEGLRKGLLGTHAGDRVVMTIPSKLAYDPTGNGTTVREGDGVVFVVDVLEVSAPSQTPEGVPQLSYTQSGEPKKFTKTKQTEKDVTSLGVSTLLKGDGPKVQKGDKVTVHYLGQIYPSGKTFDQSWDGQPFSFTAGKGQVIEGWDKGVVGQRVGSRVVLTVPYQMAYGKKGRPPAIPGKADLIFVVDILGVS